MSYSSVINEEIKLFLSGAGCIKKLSKLTTVRAKVNQSESRI